MRVRYGSNQKLEKEVALVSNLGIGLRLIPNMGRWLLNQKTDINFCGDPKITLIFNMLKISMNSKMKVINHLYLFTKKKR
jgi:hypothetical protein